MKMSLRTKTIVLLIIFALCLTSAAMFLGTMVERRIVDDNYSKKADELAATVAVTLDGDLLESVVNKVMDIYYATDNKVGNEDWQDPGYETYLSNFSEILEDEEFISVREQLTKIQNVNDVDCIYTLFPVKEDEVGVYIVDAAEGDDMAKPGSFDPIYDFNAGVFEKPEMGFPAYISNTETYGWLVTAGAPVHNSNGDVIGYAFVDISMDAIRSIAAGYIAIIGISLLVLTVAFTIIIVIRMNVGVVSPIRRMTFAAQDYCDDKENSKGFEDLDIGTGDEIETLCNSIKQMEKDIHGYYESLLNTKEELFATKLTARQNEIMSQYDALTGIRNKRGYDMQVEKLEEKIACDTADFGIAVVDLNNLKILNDKFGHKKGDEALKKLTDMLCEKFKHSPVYRYGGDEFVVVLENHDKDNYFNLVDSLHDIMIKMRDDENMDASDKISAAIGAAFYDKEIDKSVADVFKRADEKMYEVKEEMKTHGGFAPNFD